MDFMIRKGSHVQERKDSGYALRDSDLNPKSTQECKHPSNNQDPEQHGFLKLRKSHVTFSVKRNSYIISIVAHSAFAFTLMQITTEPSCRRPQPSSTLQEPYTDCQETTADDSPHVTENIPVKEPEAGKSPSTTPLSMDSDDAVLSAMAEDFADGEDEDDDELGESTQYTSFPDSQDLITLTEIPSQPNEAGEGTSVSHAVGGGAIDAELFAFG
ncbi:hypothetical protein UY3_06776 [Chelonia mydas]|uniref:Uncharacterized protein n=1 Tax=Chelonia mydas TaxID=8469 RepID=M7C672_CHEMY|nr:hypothetical protein UY3_06776 [Chelonia mydas]